MMRVRLSCGVVALMLVAANVFAQGNPTGTIYGQVTDPTNLALPGVTVTVSSPALQGLRTAVSSANGDYILPFLPPGEYSVMFELQGFATIKQSIGLKMADRQPVNVKLLIASVNEVVNVSAASSETAMTATVATTLRADMVERIPIGRSLEAATLLAPGASNNGPGNAIMISGALSYDNLNLVNGVNINETQRQQARTLFIEDAIQETKVSAGNISAEYGRFQGGVVNMITKSGGNTFGGSFRTSFSNDAWRKLTPFPGDATLDEVVPAYEFTLGGPVLKDKIWFFSAARLQKNSTNSTTPYTAFNYTKIVTDKRGEGKLTYAINNNNTLRVSYLGKSLTTKNNNFSTIMDAASLYNDRTVESLVAGNYQTVLRSNLFIEAQYSARRMNLLDQGASYMDLLKGTPIWDRSRGQARFNAPTYCAVCPNYANDMNNWDAYAKLNYFLSTKKAGSHSFVAGFDVFKDMRKNNQNSSASNYRVQATGAVIDGLNIYPIFKPSTTYVEWLPVFEDTKGSDLRTYSTFFNDVWRMNNRLTLNIGLRYDKNNIRDQGASTVADAGLFSPRFSGTFDVKGDGKWLVNAAAARYVGTFITQVADAASAAGRQASYSFLYSGPTVNGGATGPYLTSAQSLQILFDWWNATGGPNRTPRTNPTIPGVNTAVARGVQPATTNEYTAGIAHEFGAKGSVRADFVYRTFSNIYGDYVDMSTGVATDTRTGQKFNLDVVNNTNSVERAYKGLSVQFSARPFRDLQLAGNYMLSFTRGNIEAENASSVTTFASADSYPEYRQAAWNYPVGYLNGDQRHKVRVWGTYSLPVPTALGAINLGFMQRYDSGLPYDFNISIDSRPYVTNPGYLVPPSTVTYYVSRRGEFRFDSTWRTDLSLSWNRKVPGLAKAQVFLRAVMNNVFNNAALTSFNTTIIGKSGDSTLAAFNPFTTTPVEGVNWKKGPSFGQAVSPNSYQNPREYNLSIGFRF